jgi:hypothetical protein
MGIRRWLQRFTQSDEERRLGEVQDWAASVPGTTRIAESAHRARTRVAGVVRRLTIKPGEETLEAVVGDGTGELTAVWTGRSFIPGLGLGTRVTLEGLLVEERNRHRMVNPVYEFWS